LPHTSHFAILSLLFGHFFALFVPLSVHWPKLPQVRWAVSIHNNLNNPDEANWYRKISRKGAKRKRKAAKKLCAFASVLAPLREIIVDFAASRSTYPWAGTFFRLRASIVERIVRAQRIKGQPIKGNPTVQF
jgi:hypothetical protein